MQPNIIERVWRQDKMVNVDVMNGFVFTGEAEAHKFVISGKNVNTPVDISGTITANFKNADGVLVPLTGTIEGGKAVVVLSRECYAVEGPFSLMIFADTVCIYAAIANVINSSGEVIAYPTATIPSVQELIEEVQDVIASIPQDYSALNQSVTDLKSALNSTRDIVLKEYAKESFSKDFSVTSGSPIYAGTNLLPVTINAGETFSFKLIDTINAVPNYFLYKSLNGTRTVVLDQRILPNQEYRFTTDTDIDYLNIYVDSCEATGTLTAISNVIVINDNSMEQDLEDLGDIVDDLIQVVPPVNLFTGETWPTEGYISASQFNLANGYYTSNPIFLKTGSYLFCIKQSSYGGNYNILWSTDDEGTRTGYIEATDTSAKFLTDYNILKFNATEGYYRFNVGTGAEQKSKFMIVAGSSSSDFPSTYIPPDEEYILFKETVANYNKNPLYGKKIALTGDSICYGQGFYGGYGQIIANRNKMSYQNIGVSGGTICSGTTSSQGARFCICDSIDNLDSDADYIILEGGVNDNVTDKIGTISQGYTSEFDTTYFYPACESMFKAVSERFKGKKYGFIIVHQMTATMCPNGTRYNAIKECASKWGIPVLDLSIEMPPFGLLPSNNILRTTYTDNGDGWHPNEEGYKKYYVDKIEAWMKTL